MVVIVVELAAALALVLAIHDGCVLVHLRLALSLRVSTFVAGVANTGMSATLTVVQKFEELVNRRLPTNVKLLFVNHLIAVHDFLYHLFSLGLIHVPDFFDAYLVGLHEVLELSLEISKLFGQLLVLNSEVAVSLLSLLLLGEELLLYLALHFFELALLLSLRLDGGLVDLDLLLQDAVVERELLLVKLVDRLHVLHTFLKDLHLLLQLDLLLSLVVRVQVSDLFQLLGVGLLSLGAVLGVFFFDLLLLFE